MLSLQSPEVKLRSKLATEPRTIAAAIDLNSLSRVAT